MGILLYSRNSNVFLIITFIHKNVCIDFFVTVAANMHVVALSNPLDILHFPCAENGEVSSGEGWLELGWEEEEIRTARLFWFSGLLSRFNAAEIR